ncbi:MAG TPA: protein translocase subunit SecD [Steroidobacteraceae bacterium]|nr:protein translocase subunit SecD [Steroidobacteraceae bacterium]
MLDFARWKYWLVATVLLVALVFALPNFFGEDPALQVARKDRATMDAAAQTSVEEFLQSRNVAFSTTFIDTGRVMVRFDDVGEQLKARDAVNDGLGSEYITALSFAPRAPAFLRKIGLRPMPLGLDLRGGLYLLFQVDVKGAVEQLLSTYEQDFRRALSEKEIRVADVTALALDSETPNAVRVLLPPGTDPSPALELLEERFTDLAFKRSDTATGPAIDAVLTADQIRTRQNYAIQQNITTLRNRVNELGVSEPLVQRQGPERIAVQLPGVQNSADVKDLLSKVATLEFRMADETNSIAEAVSRGRAPLGSKLYRDKNEQPVLLKRDIIVTGDQLTDATSTSTQDGPTVSVRLSSQGGEEMLKNTRANVGRRMGVVFIEISRQMQKNVAGELVPREIKTEKVISLATIQGVFSNQFQITGLTTSEARDLALLLRAGALAAPIFIVEERAIGPSLGKQNIEQGVRALLIGMAVVFVFMVVYYKGFGLVACAVLLANVVLLTALLSGLRAALSLPGIAGIILTVGMAVDANILIYERIREELRNGNTPQSSIRAGFEKALSSIADANITTLIAGVVLWIFGTGAIRGFAVVLTLGIITSMFTALLGARALITLVYGGRRKVARLSI